MATKSVVKVVSDAATQTAGFDKSFPAKVYTAYGRIESTDYTINDSLTFDQIAIKKLIYAKFKAVSSGVTLELFNGADLGANTAFNLNNGGLTSDIDYVIHYEHGSVTAGTITLNINTTVSSSSSSSSDSSNSSSSSSSS